MDQSCPTPHDWIPRAHAALKALRTHRELRQEIQDAVNDFFHAHPEEPRTPESEDWVTILVFQRLADEAANGTP